MDKAGHSLLCARRFGTRVVYVAIDASQSFRRAALRRCAPCSELNVRYTSNIQQYSRTLEVDEMQLATLVDENVVNAHLRESATSTIDSIQQYSHGTRYLGTLPRLVSQLTLRPHSEAMLPTHSGLCGHSVARSTVHAIQ